jgi:hypothetical protein
MKYIYHHLGLGDHIICNGLVRSLINENENYTMFVKPNYTESVKFMYRDLKNLFFLESDDYQARNFISTNNIKNEDVIYAGFEMNPNSKEFDDNFYVMNNIPFKNRWDKFFVERDLDREKKIFNEYNVIESQYIFIHDDFSRGLHINEEYIKNKELPIVRPKEGLTNNIFDYMYLIEHAYECHFMDSSFRLMFDSLGSQKNNLYYHINYNSIKRSDTKSQSKLNYILI